MIQLQTVDTLAKELSEQHQRPLIIRDLVDVLQDKQEYVVQIGQELEIGITAIEHSVATDTCYEKAELLGWDPERVVKAMYFVITGKYDSDQDYKAVFGFIFPELGKKLKAKDVKRVLDESKLRRYLGKKEGYSPTGQQIKSGIGLGYIPKGMEYGTCTPFLLEDAEVKGIFIHKMPELDGKDVDISIGGQGDFAHRVSLHLPYEGIYQILEKQFQGKVHQLDMFEA